VPGLQPQRWRSVSAWSAAVREDGTLWAWGGAGRTRPARVGTDTDWVSVYRNIARKEDGSWWDLGDNRDSPARIDMGYQWAAMTVGGSIWRRFTVAIKTDGSLWAWGRNDWGQLGIGSDDGNISHERPVRIGTDYDWASAAAGEGHAAALRQDGTLWIWGRKGDWANGPDGFAEPMLYGNAPARMGDGTDWVFLSAGGGRTSLIRADGTLWAWGGGVRVTWAGGRTYQDRPEQVGTDTDWAFVYSGSGWAATLAIKTDGTLWAWGDNSHGRLGIGGDLRSPWDGHDTPTQVGTDSDWVSAAMGASSFGIRADGSLWAWGNNRAGQLGIGTDSSTPFRIDIPGAGETAWAYVSSGIRYSMAIRADGSLWGWGSNEARRLGLGEDAGHFYSVPVRVGTEYNWALVSTGLAHAAAVRTDGSLWAWGSNRFGQLGSGTGGGGWAYDERDSYRSAVPLRIGTEYHWVSVSAGRDSTIALRTDGSLWAWGSNDRGQLGSDETGGMVNIPTRIGADYNWASVSVGSGHALALRTDGSLWAWGSNQQGRLGIGSGAQNVPAPVRVGADYDWAFVSADWDSDIAMKTDGSLWTLRVRAQIGSDTDWVSAASSAHTVAVRADGSLWGWGTNAAGQLGIPRNDQDNIHNSPVRIGTRYDWVSASAGSESTFALRADGSLWGWGSGSFGQVGNGITTNRTSPVRVGAYTYSAAACATAPDVQYF